MHRLVILFCVHSRDRSSFFLQPMHLRFTRAEPSDATYQSCTLPSHLSSRHPTPLQRPHHRSDGQMGLLDRICPVGRNTTRVVRNKTIRLVSNHSSHRNRHVADGSFDVHVGFAYIMSVSATCAADTAPTGMANGTPLIR